MVKMTKNGSVREVATEEHRKACEKAGWKVEADKKPKGDKKVDKLLPPVEPKAKE